MERKEIEEIQSICFEIFMDIKRVCEKNNLNFFLSGGTLLGAVRHQGFIPWDDDLDLMMPRKDYEQLLKLREQFSYASSICEDDAEYTNVWMRVWDDKKYKATWPDYGEKEIGVFVDVFPIDYIANNKVSQWIIFKKLKWMDMKRLAAIRYAFQPGERLKLLKKIMALYCKKKGANYYARKMNEYLKKRSKVKKKYAGVCAVTHYGMKESMPCEVFEDKVMFPFCSVDAPGPVGYDFYLKKVYGDYMTLPSEEKRKSVHGFRFIKRNNINEEIT